MNDSAESAALGEQLDYYRARAAEYDQWWLRQGRYDRGADLNSRWFKDAQLLRDSLRRFQPGGHILELACGTGIWSEQLLPGAASLTLVDGSPEMLSIAGERLLSPKVHYEQADLFSWRPSRQFDTVFFGFWLSHVPPSRFAAFWETVAACLAPGGRVFFVDSRHEQTSTANDHQLPPPEATTLRRRLNDGREYQIYKVFYEPADLTAQMKRLGWTFGIATTPHYFLFGQGHKAPPPAPA
jgi:ubiquinone/menaquinone biosynthesis C-methylase UbiE